MRKLAAIFLTVSIISLILTLLPSFAEQEQPRVVSALEGQVPSDAVVLFDGKDISGWTYMDGQPAGWTVTDGAMTVKGGSIITRKEFGDIQLHLEFATPAEAKGSGQDRGNSGLYIQGLYEVQILDSYGNETYPDGSCAAIYKIAPPLVNASRPAGTWQTYDVIFRAPGFDVYWEPYPESSDYSVPQWSPRTGSCGSGTDFRQRIKNRKTPRPYLSPGSQPSGEIPQHLGQGTMIHLGD